VGLRRKGSFRNILIRKSNQFIANLLPHDEFMLWYFGCHMASSLNVGYLTILACDTFLLSAYESVNTLCSYLYKGSGCSPKHRLLLKLYQNK